MKRYLGLSFALVVLFAAVSTRAQESQQSDEANQRKRDKAVNNLYVVQMSGAPAVDYRGDVPGLRATRPAKGQKIDPTSPDVAAYVSYLDRRHDNAAGAAGGRKVYDYHYTFNGFAAELTPAQAEAVKSVPGVIAVSKDELQFADTSSTPTFLGLDTPGTGLWDQLGGFGQAGEDIIIGVVDSGVWPEGLSMSDRTGVNGNGTQDGKLDYHQIPGWHGKCTPGEQFPASNCNQKLIAAQWFNAAWGGDVGLKAQRPWEFASARDYNGHGSHTSSTAGGNHGVLGTGAAAVFGPMSGIAPRARIAMYKALWSTQDASTASGFTSDLVAAIDQAVADGVDVINYSISGSLTNFLDPAEIAFLNAANAGVFVAASAGNSGPTTSTVAHPSPWITTVAAGTHNRSGQGSVQLGATTYHGASLATAVGPAPFTASFSSRGPLRAGNGNLLKPDVIAPGQDIIAAVAPPGNGGQLFNLYSGTSMSSPHVAGLAALLKDLHADWTPMMIKSALMTSASDVLDANTNPLVIFRQGAGHVAHNKAADPGLVLDSGINDWLAFLCGATSGVTPATCNALAGAGFSLDPSNLNMASIAVGALPGIQTVKRRVTNVGSQTATYTAAVTGMTGFDVNVSPSSLMLSPGQTKSFNVTFTRTAAALNAYTGGQLTWTDGTHNVRMPLALRPVALAAPATVFGTGGTINYDVKFGYNGAFSATARGLIPATTTSDSVTQDPAQSFAPGGPGVKAFPVTINAGTTFARFSLFDANVSPASDLDVYVFKGSTLVGASTTGTSTEEVNLVNPAAGGDYVVYIHGFNIPGGVANFTLFSWLLGSANAGNMSVSGPNTAVTGGGGIIQLTFSGLAA